MSDTSSSVSSPGRRPSESRRLTTMSDWAGMSAETRAKVEAQIAAKKAGNNQRNPEEWVLNEPTPDIKEHCK
jgi:hypothetical protein